MTYLAVVFYSQMEPERRCASVLSAPSVFPFSNHHFLWQRLWLFLLSLFFAQSYSEAPQDDNAQKSDQYCSGVHRSHSSSKKNPFLNSLLLKKKFILKISIEFVTTLFLLYVLVFWPKAHGTLAPQPGIKPTAPVLEGKVSTTARSL